MSRPKKSLGQNFLRDPNVAQKIVRSLHLLPSDIVLEIGPGKGALTSLLLRELPHLTAVEVDDELSAALRAAHGERLTLLHNDVLNVDLPALARERGGKVRIVGNIPYNITSPILFWIIDHASAVRDCTLMMQREVAQRLVAQPGGKEYGILSVFCQYYAMSRLLFAVSANSFYPIPAVTSAVVVLNFESPAPSRAVRDGVFRRVVRGTFGKRRKTLRNSLRALGIPPERLASIPFNLDQRPEELTVDDFIKLTNSLDPFADKFLINETEDAHA